MSMEVVIEIVGIIKGQVLESNENYSQPFKIFRVYSKPYKNEETMYFNCSALLGGQAYKLIEIANISDGDEVIVRGKLNQVFVFEDGYKFEEKENGKQEKVSYKRQVCKNRVYVSSMNLLKKSNTPIGANMVDKININKEVSVQSGNREKVSLDKNDNPFG